MNPIDRIKHAWNAFRSKDTTENSFIGDYGAGSSMPTHTVTRRYSASSFSSAIFNRIAMDVASNPIHHVKKDKETDDRTTIYSGLHNCLNVEANIDQTGIQFMQDIVYSMFDEGVVAVVPVDTNVSTRVSGSFDIETMRVGRVTQWFPQHVTINLYNEITGQPQDITLPKKSVAIIENPMYAVINGPNATLQRLLKKLSLLDNVDEMIASGRLDLIIQLPYAVKTDLQKESAKQRIAKIEEQMKGNKHGIAYIDETEKITQLSRPLNDKLLDDIQTLSQQFYNQLGLTENVFNGTASESEMRGYYTRTIDPILNSIVAEFERKFLTKTARTQGQTLESYRDPFSLVPVQDIAKIADAFRRNSILTSNELRAVMGFRKSDDARADELYNPNIADKNQSTAPEVQEPPGSVTSPEDSVTLQNE